MQKTNAMRMLDKAGVSYSVKEYEIADHDERLGIRAAAQVGMPPGQVFKTLVLKGARTGYFVCCIPVDRELDLKSAAACMGDKKADMIPVKDLLQVTGYVRGGCSPIGMKKKYPVFLDSSASAFAEIAVNGGIAGKQILLSPRDLIRMTDAVSAELTLPE